MVKLLCFSQCVSVNLQNTKAQFILFQKGVELNIDSDTTLYLIKQPPYL
jgi:hypothetical protein